MYFPSRNTHDIYLRDAVGVIKMPPDIYAEHLARSDSYSVNDQDHLFER